MINDLLTVSTRLRLSVCGGTQPRLCIGLARDAFPRLAGRRADVRISGDNRLALCFQANARYRFFGFDRGGSGFAWIQIPVIYAPFPCVAEKRAATVGEATIGGEEVIARFAVPASFWHPGASDHCSAAMPPTLDGLSVMVRELNRRMNSLRQGGAHIEPIIRGGAIALRATTETIID